MKEIFLPETYEIPRILKGNIKEFVFACSWCPPSTWTPIKEGQSYTYGICPGHSEELINGTENRAKLA